MKKILSVLIIFALIKNISYSQKTLRDSNFLDQLSEQLIKKEKIIGNKFPEYTENGSWKFRNKINWLSGFLSGELWNMYKINGDEKFKNLAIAQANNLLTYSGIDYTHDMGFIFLPSCKNAYEFTGEKKYLDALIIAAEMLVKRFSGKGSFIRAWGTIDDPDKAGWIIIDTMMNLELLFWVAEKTGNREMYEIAYKHALTTLKEIVRDDFSSYHVVEFDPLTGKVLEKKTHQGFSDESTWARGQTWGIYGFAIAYKYTNDERFLNASQKMADYFISKLPNDFIPVWDLDLDSENNLRDASAGAIAASGLFQLSELIKSKDLTENYLDIAYKITSSLTNKYSFITSSRKNEEGILLHTIYHYHKKWGVDESFPAGDYYFMEALEKAMESENRKNFIKDIPFRQEYNINTDWYYLEDNCLSVTEVSKSVCNWQKIDLPHTWNNFDATDVIPGYRRDASWYLKKIYIPKINSDLNLFLHFEGVNIISEVFVNGNRAGGHVGGYIGFDVDITPYLKMDMENEILVRVDNSVNPNIIPSQKSDFFIYGGINRDVWLKVLPSSYLLEPKIKSPVVNKTLAKTELELNLFSDQKNDFEVNTIIVDNLGKTVSEITKNFSANSGENSIEINFPEITNPLLWSPENPNLYTVNIQILQKGKLIDEIHRNYGYRWFEFKEHGAFFLNGERFLIRGTHWHEDFAGLGNALPDQVKEGDFKLIKEMGANFVRLAHYPQDPKVYELCDELGLLAWDELPWCRGGVGGDEWKSNSKRLLTEMIEQNFNHSSIIIWSLGNEIYWIPDFPSGDNNDSIRFFLKELNQIAHDLDPSRLTGLRKYYEGADIVDVFSPSVWSGWYSGVYTNYSQAIEDAQKKYPKMLHVEYGGSSHVGRHDEEPIDGEGVLNPNEWEERPNQVKIDNIASMGDWSENYIVDLFDWHLRYSELSKSFTGNVQWAFKDFGTPLRPENAIPYMNQKGLVDRSGNPKDAFYVFKSYWNTNDPFCYIESKSWTDRSGPQNKSREVNVFSNCDKVELFLNQLLISKKEKDINLYPASGLSWQVNFIEGKNQLVAVGYNNEKKVAIDTLVINYSFKKQEIPQEIKVTGMKMQSGNYLIEAVVVDKNGSRCLDYNKRIYFSVSGSGNLIENMGTPTGSSTIEAANGKVQIEFKPLGFDKATIEVRNQDFKGAYLIINDD
ncbi:MAG: glycoside hydrolase family 88 protein [Ignavibacteriales bacterium]|nr:glycoside hydrolase family 88 protein [Ignavibacteriales bacterium]